jgi:hypothetical protein
MASFENQSAAWDLSKKYCTTSEEVWLDEVFQKLMSALIYAHQQATEARTSPDRYGGSHCLWEHDQKVQMFL